MGKRHLLLSSGIGSTGASGTDVVQRDCCTSGRFVSEGMATLLSKTEMHLLSNYMFIARGKILIAALLFCAEHSQRRGRAGYHVERGLFVVGGV